MARGDGYDFTPILQHYLFLVTCPLAVVAWLIAFIGQAAYQASFSRIGLGAIVVGPAVGSAWFGIFLQLFIILGVFHTLATDSVALNRLQLSIFGAIALVMTVDGTTTGLFTPVPAAIAMGVGYLLLSIINILWILYFTSEEGSLTLHVFNSLGTGGISGPGRRGRGGAARGQSMVGVGMGNNTYAGPGIGGGYTSPGGMGYGNMAMPMGPGAPGSNLGLAPGDVKVPDGGLGFGVSSPVRSQHSLGAAGGGVGMGGGTPAAEARSLNGGGGGSITGSTRTGGAPGGQEAPLMGVGAQSPGPDQESYSYRAKALYAYTASPDDPNEISFAKGEILDIMDNSGKWWQAKKADGQTGIAPSNYLQII